MVETNVNKINLNKLKLHTWAFTDGPVGVSVKALLIKWARDCGIGIECSCGSKYPDCDCPGGEMQMKSISSSSLSDDQLNNSFQALGETLAVVTQKIVELEAVNASLETRLKALEDRGCCKVVTEKVNKKTTEKSSKDKTD